MQWNQVYDRKLHLIALSIEPSDRRYRRTHSFRFQAMSRSCENDIAWTDAAEHTGTHNSSGQVLAWGRNIRAITGLLWVSQSARGYLANSSVNIAPRPQSCQHLRPWRPVAIAKARQSKDETKNYHPRWGYCLQAMTLPIQTSIPNAFS